MDWKEYHETALAFVDQGAFAEDQKRDEARNQVAQEFMTHRKWFESMEAVFWKAVWQEGQQKAKEVPDQIQDVFVDMVSGQLDFSITFHDPARLVVFSSKERPDVYIPTEKTGSFFVMLPRDTYSLTMRATHVDEQMVIVFTPITLDISVTDKPISNLYFFPVHITVSGQVECLGSCHDPSATLKLYGGSLLLVASSGTAWLSQ
jgi:hypothetical protein